MGRDELKATIDEIIARIEQSGEDVKELLGCTTTQANLARGGTSPCTAAALREWSRWTR